MTSSVLAKLSGLKLTNTANLVPKLYLLRNVLTTVISTCEFVMFKYLDFIGS